MDNKYTAEVSIEISGKKHTIVYDWDALATLRSEYKPDIVHDLFKYQKPDLLAEILAIGLKRHHPQMTAKKIKDASPPFIATVDAIDRALTYAYFGADGPPKETGEATGNKKKTPKKTK